MIVAEPLYFVKISFNLESLVFSPAWGMMLFKSLKNNYIDFKLFQEAMYLKKVKPQEVEFPYMYKSRSSLFQFLRWSAEVVTRTSAEQGTIRKIGPAIFPSCLSNTGKTMLKWMNLYIIKEKNIILEKEIFMTFVF